MKTSKAKVTAEQRRKLPHAGPGTSFPLQPDLIESAWDLAGHTDNPDEVRRKVIRYAREHGLLDRLPDTARAWMRAHSGDLVQKARGGVQRELLHHAFNNSDDFTRRELIEFAQTEGIMPDMPDEAHGFMHQHNMPHIHSDDDHPMHAHPVVKAFNPEAFQFLIQKSWVGEDGVTYFEGWDSPGSTRDREKEISPPEAFSNALPGFLMRGGPITSEHETEHYPVGHVQKAALVRDGKIFQEALHPADPHDFEHFEEFIQDGPVKTGVYIRGALTESPAKDMVRKGNVRGLSWIGNARKFHLLPGGGREYEEIDPLLEMTVAAFPVHKDAAILIAKAYGLEEEEEQVNIEEMLAKLLEEKLAGMKPEPEPEQVQKGFTEEDVKKAVQEALEKQKSELEKSIDERVQKAITLQRGNPTESRQEKTPEQELNEDPITFLVKKGESAKSEEDFTQLEKYLIWEATAAVIGNGLIGGKE
jgi:hypothetical protein